VAGQAGLGRRLGTGAVFQQRGGDGADRQGGHDQHGVAEDRGVQAGLALVEADAVLAELEIFFDWPSQPAAPISRVLVSIWPSGT